MMTNIFFEKLTKRDVAAGKPYRIINVYCLLCRHCIAKGLKVNVDVDIKKTYSAGCTKCNKVVACKIEEQ